MAKPKKRGSRVSETKIVQILTEAQHFGDAATAKKYRISVRTIGRYRDRANRDPKLSDAVRAEKATEMKGWREQLVTAREQILSRVVELSAKSDNLFHVSGALKIVADATNADELIETLGGNGGGLSGAGAGSTQPGTAVAEAPRRALAILSGGKS